MINKPAGDTVRRYGRAPFRPLRRKKSARRRRPRCRRREETTRNHFQCQNQQIVTVVFASIAFSVLCLFLFFSVFRQFLLLGMPFIQLFRFHFHCRHSRNVHRYFVFLLPHHAKHLFALDCTRHNFHIFSSSYFSSFAFRSTCRNGFHFRTALGDGKQIYDVIGAHNDIQTWSTEHMQAFIIDKFHNEIIQFRSPRQRKVFSLCTWNRVVNRTAWIATTQSTNQILRFSANAFCRHKHDSVESINQIIPVRMMN